MSDLIARLRANRPFQLAAVFFAVIAAVWLVVDRPVKAERRLADRVHSGKPVPAHFYVPVYLWRGLTLNLILAAIAAGLCTQAGREIAKTNVPLKIYGRPEMWFIAGCFVIAAVQGASRLDFSAWGDEDYTIKTYVADQVEETSHGDYKLTPVHWTEALWHNKRPNNHVGYSVMANVVHTAFFKRGDGPIEPFFSERLARTPAYLFGLLSVLTLAWMGRVWGWTHAMPIVIFYYITHPWITRFGSDARGYSVMLAGLPAIFALAGRATQAGQWRWWLLLGLTEAFVFWCYWGVVYVLVPLHIGLLVFCLTDDSRLPTQRKTMAARSLVSGLVFSMIIVQLMAPGLPQLLDFVRDASHRIAGVMDRTWWQDAVGYVLFGTTWNPWAVSAPLCVALSDLTGLRLCAAVVAGAVISLLILAGVRRCWMLRSTRWVLLPVFLSPILFLGHMTHSGVRPYHWYLTLFFPAMLLLLSAGLSSCLSGMVSWIRPSDCSKRLALSDIVWPGLALLGVSLAVVVASPQRRMLIDHPFEQSRESVALTRTITNPRNPAYGTDSITGGFTMFTEAYDPGLVRFHTVEEMLALMERARQSHRPFYVNFSSRAFCKANYPDLFKLFDDPTKFELVAVLPGQFDAATREVVKMK